VLDQARAAPQVEAGGRRGERRDQQDRRVAPRAHRRAVAVHRALRSLVDHHRRRARQVRDARPDGHVPDVRARVEDPLDCAHLQEFTSEGAVSRTRFHLPAVWAERRLWAILPRMKKTTLILISLLSLAITAAPAAGKTVAYKGKTKSGHSITFKREGGKIKNVQSMVPTVCLTTSGGSDSTRTGGDIYQPPGAYALGKTTKRKAFQRTPFYPAKVTKNYTLTAKTGSKGKITGKLDENFSFSLLGLDPWSGNSYIRIFICQGVTNFTAKPKS
jgi:hypothetical protein